MLQTGNCFKLNLDWPLGHADLTIKRGFPGFQAPLFGMSWNAVSRSRTPTCCECQQQRSQKCWRWLLSLCFTPRRAASFCYVAQVATGFLMAFTWRTGRRGHQAVADVGRDSHKHPSENQRILITVAVAMVGITGMTESAPPFRLRRVDASTEKGSCESHDAKNHFIALLRHDGIKP